MLKIGAGQAVRNFGRVHDAVKIPDLVAIQRRSYERFLQEDVPPTKRKRIGLEALFQEIFPIESYDKSMLLEYLYYELERPRYSPSECRQLRLTYGYPLKISCRMRSKDGEDLAEQAIYLGEIPVMVGGGEFIINGAVRVIVSQLHRSPGVDFLIESKEGDRVLHGGRIIPERGSWIEIGVTRKDVLVVRIDQSSKIPATIFLRAMDEVFGSNEAILRVFYPTKTVPVAELTSAMWVVGPIVDKETGEVVVDAGTQIGDRISLIQSANVSTSTGGSRTAPTSTKMNEKQAKKYLKTKTGCIWLEKNQKRLREMYIVKGGKRTGGFAFKYVETQNTLTKPQLEAVETKLIGTEKPRFNKDSGKSEDTVKDLWNENPYLETFYHECKDAIRSNTDWVEIKDLKECKKGLPKGQGMYFFRSLKTNKVSDGYLGLATSLKDRLGMHFSAPFKASKPEDCGDNLLKTWAITELTEYGVGVEGGPEKKVPPPKPPTGEIEVIEDVRDPMILNTLAEDDCPSHERALLKFYMRLRPGNPPSVEKAKKFFEEKFFDSNRYRLGKVGRFRLNRKFGQAVDENEMTLRPDDFLATMKYIVALRNNEGAVDDIDHLGNRRLRTIEELAGDEIRKGLLKLRKTVQERMSLKRRDEDEPKRIADLVNSKSVSSSINYFFGRGELSQVVDQTNALSQLTHERRLSALGPGGLNRRRAGFEVRDVHISHYGRVCPIETPEGTNIGLIASLAIFATVDEYGFLLTPYYKVKKQTVRIDPDQFNFLKKLGDVCKRLSKKESKRVCCEFMNSPFKGERAYKWVRKIYMEGVRGLEDEFPGLEFKWIRTDEDNEFLSAEQLQALEEKLTHEYPDRVNGKYIPRLNKAEKRQKIIEKLDDIFRDSDKLCKLFERCKREIDIGAGWYRCDSVEKCAEYVKKEKDLGKESDEQGPQGVYFFRPLNGEVNEGYIGLAGEEKATNSNAQGLRKRLGYHFAGNYGKTLSVSGTDRSFLDRLMDDCMRRDWEVIEKKAERTTEVVVTDEVDYLRADEEMKAIFAPPSTVNADTGKLVEGLVLARKGGELAQVSSDEVDYVDISPKQIVGVSASLIPFLEHDDANRALMGSNMQRQAVPLLKTEPPLVGTGMERVVGENSSMVRRAKSSSVVTAVDATKIVLDHTDEYKLRKFEGLNERTCLNQKPVVALGEKVQTGQIIADGGGTANGVLALGKNLLVGFVSFDGFNFEDAIIVSEKLCKNDSFTSIHIDEFTAEVRETRLGREEFTRDIPNVSEKALRNLDEYGVVCEGTRVCTGDILVGKVVPKSKTELTPEEKLLHAIFGRAGEDVKNDSLELPSGYEGVVIKTERFTRRGVATDEEKKALAAEIRQYEKRARAKECMVFRQMIEAIHKKFDVNIVDPSTRQKVGQSPNEEVIYEQVENFNIKWVRPASARDDVQKIIEKGFWGKITEIQEEKKRRTDSMKHGDELPSGVLQMVKVYVAVKRALSIGDKVAGRHGNKGVIAKIMPEEDMPFLEDGTSLDILLNPLGVPSRMNVGQILETHLGWVAKVLGFNAVTPVFDGATEDDIRELTAEANGYVNRRAEEIHASTYAQELQDLISAYKSSESSEDKKVVKVGLELWLSVFKVVYTDKGRKLSADELEKLEDAVIASFPDALSRSDDRAHLPRFCRKPKSPSAAMKALEEVLTSEKLKPHYDASLAAIRGSDGKPWLTANRASFELVENRQGLYFFRNSVSGRVNEGYIGLAGKSNQMLRDRLLLHLGGRSGNNFVERFKEEADYQFKSYMSAKAINSDEIMVRVPKTLKTQLYDGRTGEPFDQSATIGYIYMMKLHHLVDDKIHARATGPYSLITQQPLGGKARTGGQRFGEMEVWALEGYGAAYTLQEMLTVKSDDVEGRTKIYESMVKGQNVLEAGTPLSFDVLCNEIRGLGLNIQLEKKRLGGMAL